MIELRRVTKTYELGKTKVEALRCVSLKIERGDFAVIVGPSGSGKTTMLNIAGLLDRASSGVVFRQVDVAVPAGVIAPLGQLDVDGRER